MSIRWLPREMGIVLCCNGTDDKGCPDNQRTQTGNIIAKHNRSHAARSGWGRGLRKGYKRRDLCPSCMPLERELFAKEQVDAAAWKAQRDENRKAKLLEKKAAQPKKPRKGKAAANEVEHCPTGEADSIAKESLRSSPSADCAPAPA